MLIETTEIRKGGSKHSIGDKVYHFKPGLDGRHVCDVVDNAHIQRFLSLEPFMPYEEKPLGGEVAAPVTNEVAFAALEDIYAELSDEDLAERYSEVLGKKPHHKAKRETLVAALMDAEHSPAPE
ncbi:hypothetical protein RAZWK3B_16695 [Roseobacter sp. AzwK-3b]|uniref:hypothetical protein n=1 Tax=Roseobacter sp. AzwK-3b TaxID=351016 RepID=UPI000156988B|nr:hypothetical protein [Roseobacter sp. AzwK-3b]EDM71054.1 hypothetical protein RAZWK3B_16695 [Roseobacter sp. AzwK-3b]